MQHKLQVASCKLLVASCQLLVSSCSCAGDNFSFWLPLSCCCSLSLLLLLLQLLLLQLLLLQLLLSWNKQRAAGIPLSLPPISYSIQYICCRCCCSCRCRCCCCCCFYTPMLLMLLMLLMLPCNRRRREFDARAIVYHFCSATPTRKETTDTSIQKTNP